MAYQPDYTGAYISTGNSSTTNLAVGNSYTFTGTGEKTNHPDVMVNLYADQATTIQIQFSQDGTNWDSTLTKYGASGSNEFTTAVKGARYVRVVVTTASLTTTVFRLQTQFGQFRQGNSPFTNAIAPDADAMIVRTGNEDEIMQGKVKDQYIIAKYGRNADVDAAEDIWNGGGDYTGFPTTTAEEFQVLSSDPNDTSAGTGARTVRVWYLDSNYEMCDSSGNFLYFDVTLNGTTAVNSGVTGMRVWRALVLTSGSGQTNAGDITVRWRTTTSVIFAVMPAGFAQTALTNFTIPNGCTGYLKRLHVSMSDLTSNQAQMAIKVRDFGSNTFRLTRMFSVSTSSDYDDAFYGGIKYEAKTDFVFRCTSISNTNGTINVAYGLLLIKN